MVALTHHHEEPAFEDICLTPKEIQIRKIGLNDLWQSLREGYEDFGTKPGSAVLLLIVFYVLAALIVTLFAFGKELRYLASCDLGRIAYRRFISLFPNLLERFYLSYYIFYVSFADDLSRKLYGLFDANFPGYCPCFLPGS